MKLFGKDSATIPSTHQSDGTIRLDNANMLNNYHSKCFTTSLPPLYGSFESAGHLELPEGGPENLLCTEKEVIIMSSTISRCFKASGHGRMLKFTAASIDAVVTSKLFSQSINNSCNSFVPRTIHNWNTFSSNVPLAGFSVSLFQTNFWIVL